MMRIKFLVQNIQSIPLRTQYSPRPFSTHSRFASTLAVKITEVGPRDGLQNIKALVPTSIKVELIRKLAASGLRHVEATSFVSPKWVPQLADGADVMKEVLSLSSQDGIHLPVLTPNLRGLQNAIKSGATEVVIFASATEEFSKRNQNCSVDDALMEAEKVAAEAQNNKIAVRGVVSCIFADPYSGSTDPESVLRVVQRLLAMGCHEVGLGDTLGVGTPKTTQTLLEVLLRDVSVEKLAGHFHDTYGQAVANVMRAYDMGIRSFDSSVAGLGGCPFAKGAKGNVATEDLVYSFEKSGIHTGIDFQKLVAVGDWISRYLNLPNNSRAGSALVAKAESPVQTSSATAGTVAPNHKREWKQIEDDEEYKVARAGHAIKITLTRSRKGNSMTPNMLEGVTRLFRTLSKDKSIFHIILAAEGKFFCTGMDLSGGTDRTTKTTNEPSYYDKVVNLFKAIDESPQTTITLIDGPCFGGGVGLSFVCDVRIASQKARWTLTEIKLGLTPAIISKYLAREWGIPFFREAMLSAREVTPQELQRLGTIHQLHSESTDLNAVLDEYLDRLDRCAPQSAVACKELVRLSWADPNGAALDSFIQKTFDTMMKPGSEGEFGIQQFQQKIKNINWGQFWSAGQAKL